MYVINRDTGQRLVMGAYGHICRYTLYRAVRLAGKNSLTANQNEWLRTLTIRTSVLLYFRILQQTDLQ